MPKKGKTSAKKKGKKSPLIPKKNEWSNEVREAWIKSCLQSQYPEEEVPSKMCDMADCNKMCVPTKPFENTNITCLKCKHFMCTDCTNELWLNEWTVEDFYKPKINMRGLKHQVFVCRFCDVSFDKLEEV